MGLGTAFSCRLAQSTVSPLQSQTCGQTDNLDSSAPYDIPRNRTVAHTAAYMAKSATRVDRLNSEDGTTTLKRTKSDPCLLRLSGIMSIIRGLTVAPSQQTDRFRFLRCCLFRCQLVKYLDCFGMIVRSFGIEFNLMDGLVVFVCLGC
ncbi:hypothetical protein JTE90_002893 [Oedothorax gibbosus]|uniref:Uncharacterized protein n=1 Tax=Oedothorax gibbosus TaxID=931172 RepID=A0AAV6VC73_9ARAC|nr:hypothetical protein JTE90_002893 [Oedothorax gibbosus]